MRFSIKTLLLILAFICLFGCAVNKEPIQPSKAKQVDTSLYSSKVDTRLSSSKFDTSLYSSKVDNFLIIFDASASMKLKFDEIQKFDIAKALALKMNDMIPEMGQTAGLRSFGHSDKAPINLTELFYGMEKYYTLELSKSLGNITEPVGFSPLSNSIAAAGDDLDRFPGQMNAVILITDGLNWPGNALASARELKARYGSSICFYPILVGNDPKGKILLKKIAAIGECGFYSTGDRLLNRANMVNFVENVFLEKKISKPAKIVENDADNDDHGQCPKTPFGLKFNADGCCVFEYIYFDFRKDVLKPIAYPLLNNVVKFLEKNPTMDVELHGHCDNIGTLEYNMDLSMKRAQAVKNYLIRNGVLQNRLAIKGFGKTKPIAANTTGKGRGMNRRVEIHTKCRP